MPIQLRCFNNIWPFFTNVALCRCGSYTHGSQRLMVSTEIVKNWGGGKMGGQKIILGGHLPPLAPPLALTILFQRCLLNKNISKCLQFYINCGWIGYIIDVPTRPFPIDYFNAKTDDCITVLTILFIVT